MIQALYAIESAKNSNSLVLRARFDLQEFRRLGQKSKQYRAPAPFGVVKAAKMPTVSCSGPFSMVRNLKFAWGSVRLRCFCFENSKNTNSIVLRALLEGQKFKICLGVRALALFLL